MRPTFLIIGAAKCGTTTLWDALRRHPDVFMPELKEINFFQNRWDRGHKWYEALFSGADGQHAIGEASTSYTAWHVTPEVVDRIADFVPDAKLIYIVRHPLDKIESQWLQLMRSSSPRVSRSFNEAVLREELITSANFLRYVTMYRRRFTADQMLVLFLDDLRSDQPRVFARCAEFLGIDPRALAAVDARPKNVASARLVDTSIASWLRRIPGVTAVASALPEAVSLPLKRLVRRTAATNRPSWDPEVRRWAIAQLRGPTEDFLVACGKPRDFWEMENSSTRTSPGRANLRFPDQTS